MSDRKPLKRIRYDVAFDVDGERQQHEIEVGPADQLRSEIEGKRHGLPDSMRDAPVNYATYAMYLALVRTGLYTGKWQQFLNVDLYDFDQVKADQDDPDGAAVDPTTADTSASASSAPATSATPDSGSTPTSTSGS